MQFWFSKAQEGTLVFLSPSWLIISVAVASILILLFLLPRKGAEHRYIIPELVLWGITLLILNFAAAQPQLRIEFEKEERSRVVIAVDNSLSMSIREEGTPRSAKAQELMRKITEKLDGTIDTYGFDSQLHIQPEFDFSGKGTDIASTLYSIKDRYLGQDLRGLILITDGIDRGILSKFMEEQPDKLSDVLPELDMPINIYQVSSEQSLYDASVLEVNSGGFAYTRSLFKLKAKVQGNPNEKLEVALYKDDKLVVTKRAKVKDGPVRREKQRFNVQLDEEGQ